MNEFSSTIGQPNTVSIAFFFVFVAATLVITYFAELLIDNISSRLTWQWMLKRVLAPTMILCVVNLLWLRAM